MTTLPEAPATPPWHDRDMSWLAFNGRVLQEAEDPSVPLLERLKFLAIYSSNLDEFFRVRMARADRQWRKGTPGAAERHADLIRLVDRQQTRLGQIFRDALLPALRRAGILWLQPHTLDPDSEAWLREWYAGSTLGQQAPIALIDGAERPFLANRRIAFVYALAPRFPGDETLVAVKPWPQDQERFVRLPSAEGLERVILLDDVERLCSPSEIAGRRVTGCYTVKVSRDAELYLDDEQGNDFVERLRKSLPKRETGAPSRLLYDQHMPEVILRAFVQAYGLDQHVLVPGGQYHSFHDFFAFPFRDRLDLQDEALPPQAHPVLQSGRSVFDILQDGDQLIHFPYQQFAPVYEWLTEAANDPAVRSISMTLYRVARDSRVAAALVTACQQGKKVLVLVEAKARFDEASNLYWLDELRSQGATVLPVFDDLKVHAKLLAIEREEAGRLRPYAYFGTGNFNEQSAELYGDHGLLTADPRLSAEALAVFQFLQTREFPAFEYLLVAPNGMRPALVSMLDKQIQRAQAGQPAQVRLKMNSLEDPDMIAQLYRASQAGVQVDLIVRGICCLVPGVPGYSEHIRAISIVDRFLEHARCWIFGPSGDEQVYLASADWMTRNLSKRVEVGFPILDPAHRATLLTLWDLQWSDNQKARILDGAGLNRYVPAGDSPVRAQTAAYELFAGNAVTGEKG